MPYFILGIAVIVGLFLIVRGLVNADPKVVVRVLKWGGIVVVCLFVLYLATIGRLGLLTGVVAAAMPIFLRWRALARMAKGFRGPSPGQSSDIETPYLRMSLDHDTGVLRGTILNGRFRGRLLEELSLEELLQLLHELRVEDEQSATILETYIERIHGTDWRAQAGGAGAHGNGDARAGAGSRWGGRPPGGMTVEEALEVLGLEEGASKDDIKEAHRRLMLKNHPDHGGSTYLAAKINQAKDLLLGE
jgi:hypothetical protein